MAIANKTFMKRPKRALEKSFTTEEMMERVQQSEEDFRKGNYKSTEQLLKRFLIK